MQPSYVDALTRTLSLPSKKKYLKRMGFKKIIIRGTAFDKNGVSLGAVKTRVIILK
jgi:hypothetical protein